MQYYQEPISNQTTSLEFICKGKSVGKMAYNYYRCICGNEKLIAQGHVRSGHTKSCGCLKAKSQEARRTTYEWKDTREYSIWSTMLKRCRNPNYKKYYDYGGRGITVCDRWLKFENFFEDMGVAPSPTHQIDRIDNNDGYYPENCRWVTPKENQRNKRSNVLLEWDGQVKCLAEWIEQQGLKPYVVVNRRKCGWSDLEALELVPRESKSKKT